MVKLKYNFDQFWSFLFVQTIFSMTCAKYNCNSTYYSIVADASICTCMPIKKTNIIGLGIIHIWRHHFWWVGLPPLEFTILSYVMTPPLLDKSERWLTIILIKNLSYFGFPLPLIPWWHNIWIVPSTPTHHHSQLNHFQDA